MKPEEAIKHLLAQRSLKFYYVSDFKGSDLHKALDMAMEALEKQIPKKPVHEHSEHEKHDWQKMRMEQLMKVLFESGYHVGVVCERCYEAVCVMCHEDYEEYAGKCVVDKYYCPMCGERVSHSKRCGECGQLLNWENETNEQGE